MSSTKSQHNDCEIIDIEKPTEMTTSYQQQIEEHDIEQQITVQTRLSAIQKKLEPLMLYVVSMAQFIDIMNGSAMTVAIVDISKNLNFDSYSTQWIVSSYIVTFGGFLLLSGRIGDMYGHRNVFLAGQIWFGVWSLIVSFSTTPVMFCITRALQGIGASMSVPTALGLITTTYPVGPKRTKALSIFGGFGASGAAIGLMIAGAFIASMDWSWIFKFSSILSFIIFAAGIFTIPSTPIKKDQPKLDIFGAISVTASMICIIYYISTGSSTGWASAQNLPVLIAGVVLLGAFVWIETRWVSSPIMPFRIWKLKNFSSAFVAVIFFQGQFQGFCYYSSLIFQNVMGYSIMKTSLAFLAHSIATIITFTILGKILPKYRLKPFVLFGFSFRCFAAIMFAYVTSSTSYWTLPFFGLMVHVIGIGTSLLPAQITALKDGRNEEQGVIGALYSTAMQIGAPFGLAIVTAISENTVNFNGHEDSVELLMESYRYGLFGVAGLGVIGFILTAFLMPNTPATPATPAAAPITTPASEPVHGSESESDARSDKIETMSGSTQDTPDEKLDIKVQP
ncbi:hypothetical protein BGZ76_010770 [Entomortierella beljakovae]|nr:hypothetical protein BGZ76_010770 [Entomortierella beljakovae]